MGHPLQKSLKLKAGFLISLFLLKPSDLRKGKVQFCLITMINPKMYFVSRDLVAAAQSDINTTSKAESDVSCVRISPNGLLPIKIHP
uniref:Uncharacterized protein n=1 Tax=Solanum lycopersicum TaxID=4081 RepID=A0A3Q7FBB0_SOLLC